MYSRTELCLLAQAYFEATGVGAATLSRRTVGNTKLFVRLLDGLDCTVRSVEAASVWLDLNWPDEAVWPEGVRPRGTALAVVPLAEFWPRPILSPAGNRPPLKRHVRTLALVE
jgi:hypothetical protein